MKSVVTWDFFNSSWICVAVQSRQDIGVLAIEDEQQTLK